MEITPRKNVILADFSSYKIGGPAEYFFEAKDWYEAEESLRWSKDNNSPIFILGGGTNILIPDDGIRGLVLKPLIDTLEFNDNVVLVGAGILMADLVYAVADLGLSGLEWAGGLPGTVGGAVRGNAGAFGGEMKDAVEYVESIDEKSFKKNTRDNSGCEFDYRNSIFKKNNREIVLQIALKLDRGSPEQIKKSIEEKIQYRKDRHPMEYPNIGSMFKNVDAKKASSELIKEAREVIKTDPFPVIPAAYLISEAGLKGVSFGGAMISQKHPNFIVNISKAKSSDVKELISLAKEEVRKKFGVTLEEEVLILK